MLAVEHMNKNTILLLVEDDPNDVLLVQNEFKDDLAHVRIQHVGDGREAVHYLKGEGRFKKREAHPLPNVILLDLKMPGFDGFDFLKWLHYEADSALRVIPVIVISSSVLERDIKLAYALGANSYMCKPADWDKFKERIRILGIYWTAHAETPVVRHQPCGQD